MYSDEGDNYDYEKGMHAIIPIRWDDSGKILTIGDRVGQYPGMPEEVVFNIVWVSPNHGTGEIAETRPDKVVRYRGKQIILKRE